MTETPLTAALAAAAGQLRTSSDRLAKLDSVAGDGDLGITAVNVANALDEALALVEDGTAATTLRACGLAVAEAAPSSCGTLLAAGLLAAARSAKDTVEREPLGRVALGLAAALDEIVKRGRAAVGDKTMLDAIAPAVTSLANAGPAELAQALSASADAAQAGAAATAEMTPRVGRTSWLPDASAGSVDAGAELFALAWRAVAASVANPPSPTNEERDLS